MTHYCLIYFMFPDEGNYTAVVSGNQMWGRGYKSNLDLAAPVGEDQHRLR